MGEYKISVGKYEYTRLNWIRPGKFGPVYKGNLKENPSVPAAITRIKKEGAGPSRQLYNEVRMLAHLSKDNQHILAMLDFCQTFDHIYIVMEYCNGCSFETLLLVTGTLSQYMVQVFLRHLSSAMKTLSDKRIVHRNLNPTSIVVTYGEDWIMYKVADFDCATYLHEDAGPMFWDASRYTAPELYLSKQHDHKTDLWSIGVMAFESATGETPVFGYDGKGERGMVAPPGVLAGIREDLQDLLEGLLKIDPGRRVGLQGFFDHPFLKT